ncbi:MAG: caspase family protein [Planctomycetes bacterium]|nr:caspase family protein [Planctomycetota bacterium]
MVGISDYQHLIPIEQDPKGDEEAYDLRFADDDARAVEALLRDQLKYDNVICLLDAQATRDGILEAFNRLLNLAKPFDTVFVFLSGHGFKRDKKTYFMPHEAKLNLLKHHGIGLDEVFSNELRQCAADHKLLVLDCCHSGGATSKAAKESRASFSESELRDLSGKGLYILTACKKDEVAYEDDKNSRGYFSRVFLEALKDGKADIYRKGNQDGLVSGDEVYCYSSTICPTRSARTKALPLSRRRSGTHRTRARRSSPAWAEGAAGNGKSRFA